MQERGAPLDGRPDGLSTSPWRRCSAGQKCSGGEKYWLCAPSWKLFEVWCFDESLHGREFSANTAWHVVNDGSGQPWWCLIIELADVSHISKLFDTSLVLNCLPFRSLGEQPSTLCNVARRGNAWNSELIEVKRRQLHLRCKIYFQILEVMFLQCSV